MAHLTDLFKNKKNDFFIDADSDASEAIRMMDKQSISTLFVSENDNLVGIFTFKDYMHSAIFNKFDKNLQKVRNFMTTDVPSASSDSKVEDCIDLMRINNFSLLAITQEGKFIGFLNFEQLNESVIKERDFTINQLTNYITGEASFDGFISSSEMLKNKNLKLPIQLTK